MRPEGAVRVGSSQGVASGGDRRWRNRYLVPGDLAEGFEEASKRYDDWELMNAIFKAPGMYEDGFLRLKKGADVLELTFSPRSSHEGWFVLHVDLLRD